MEIEKPPKLFGETNSIETIPGRLYVGNLPIDISPTDIQNRFGNFPGFEIRGIHPVYSQTTGDFKGMVYIDYNLDKHGRVSPEMNAPGKQAVRTNDPLTKFLRTYNGLMWRGKKLRVEEARVDIYKRLEAERMAAKAMKDVTNTRQIDTSGIKEAIASRVEKDLRVLQVRHTSSSSNDDTAYRVRRRTYERFTRVYPRPLPTTVEAEQKTAARLHGMPLSKRLRQKQNLRPFGLRLALSSVDHNDHGSDDVHAHVDWTSLPYTPRSLHELNVGLQNLYWCLRQFHKELEELASPDTTGCVDLDLEESPSLPTESAEESSSETKAAMESQTIITNSHQKDDHGADEPSAGNINENNSTQSTMDLQEDETMEEITPEPQTSDANDMDDDNESALSADPKAVVEDNPLSWLFSDALSDVSDSFVMDEGSEQSELTESSGAKEEDPRSLEMESCSDSDTDIELEPVVDAPIDESTTDSDLDLAFSEAKRSSKGKSSKSSSAKNDKSSKDSSSSSSTSRKRDVSAASALNGDTRRANKRQRDDDDDDEEEKKRPHKHNAHYDDAVGAVDSAEDVQEDGESNKKKEKQLTSTASSSKDQVAESTNPAANRKLSKHERRLQRRNAKKELQNAGSDTNKKATRAMEDDDLSIELSNERARQLNLLDSMNLEDKSLMQELMEEDDVRVPIWQNPDVVAPGAIEKVNKDIPDEDVEKAHEKAPIEGSIAEESAVESDAAEHKKLSRKQKRKLLKRQMEEMERQKAQQVEASRTPAPSIEEDGEEMGEKPSKSASENTEAKVDRSKSTKKTDKDKRRKESADEEEPVRLATTADASDVFEIKTNWRKLVYGEELANAGRSQIPIKLGEDGKPILLPAKEVVKDKDGNEKKITLARPESKPLEPFFGYVPAHKDTTFSVEEINKQASFSFSFFGSSEDDKNAPDSVEEGDKTTTSQETSNNPFQVASSAAETTRKPSKEKKQAKRPKAARQQSTVPSQVVATNTPVNPGLLRSVASSFGAFAGAAVPAQTSNLKDDFRLKMKMMKNSAFDSQKRKMRK